MNDFRKLEVWQLSKELTIDIYGITSKFPDAEKFGLINQIRRSSVSIISNIAEGSGRDTNPDYLRFITIALGSSYELDAQLEISFELNYISKSDYDELNSKLISIKKMLYNFSKYLKSNN